MCYNQIPALGLPTHKNNSHLLIRLFAFITSFNATILEAGLFDYPHLPTREQRLREGKKLAKGHTGRKRLSLEISPASLAPKLFPYTN